MKGYKGFDKDLCCRGFQYEVGKTYEMEGSPIICDRGFHFAAGLSTVEEFYPLIDYYEYYNDEKTRYIPCFSENRYCEIEALGEIVGQDEIFPKLATNKIRIVRELSKEEIHKHIRHWLRYRYTEQEVKVIEDALLGFLGVEV